MVISQLKVTEMLVNCQNRKIFTLKCPLIFFFLITHALCAADLILIGLKRTASKRSHFNHQISGFGANTKKLVVKVESRDQKSEVNLDNQIITLNMHLSG